jgi:hypothetical protein
MWTDAHGGYPFIYTIVWYDICWKELGSGLAFMNVKISNVEYP